MSSTTQSSATTPERARPGVAVITDVDGCILDARTYSPGPARAALRLLERRGVPVVLCTSKTRVEIRRLYVELGIRLPAIIESGTAILVPAGTLPVRPARGRRTRDGMLLALAPPIAEVRSGLAEIRRIMSGAVRGFGGMTARDVARLTGLDTAAARRAARREYDEPFVFTADPRPHERAIRGVLRQRGLAITRGGRFHHLHGRTDKGRAVRLVLTWLRAAHGDDLRLLALGDSPHDLAFLREADVAVIVPRADGSVDPLLARRLPRAFRAPAPGPAGWTAAVKRVLGGLQAINDRRL